MAGRYRRCGCSGLYIGAQEAFWYANNRRENPPVFFTLALLLLLHRFSWIFHKKWKRPKLLPPKKDQPAAAAPDGYTASAVIAPKAFERGWSRDGKSFMDLWGDVYPSRGGSTLFMTDVITFVVMMPIPEFSRFHDNVRESPKFNLYLFKKGKKKVEGNSSSAA